MTESSHAMLMKMVYRAFLCLLTCGLFLVVNSRVVAQSTGQVPSPAGFVNDFAGVVDAQTKSRLETLLSNLKDKTKVEFYVATFDTTGPGDIFDFSRRLSSDWNVGAKNSNTKSLLLVISVATKESFTQFSKRMQSSLPDGVLGDMSQHMRSPLEGGRFSEAVIAGVQLFVNSLAQKMGFVAEELDTSAGTDTASSSSQVADRTAESSTKEVAQTRPRVVKETAKPTEKETATDTAPVDIKSATPTESPASANAFEAKSTEPAERKPPEKGPLTNSSRAETKAAKKSPATKKISCASRRRGGSGRS
jgi:uncharacterized protein